MNLEETRHHIEWLGVHDQLGPVGQGWGIEQNAHEFATFLCALPNVRTVLEVGTGYRAGLARFMTEALGWEVTTVDQNVPQTPAPLARQVIGKVVDVVGKIYGQYDLVIIDASHDYHSVKEDTALVASMGQIVMYHDIAGLRGCEGVARYWKEISRDAGWNMRSGYHEVIADGPQAAGIGWIVKSELQHDEPVVVKPVVVEPTKKGGRKR
jgi:hypothetical protein